MNDSRLVKGLRVYQGLIMQMLESFGCHEPPTAVRWFTSSGTAIDGNMQVWPRLRTAYEMSHGGSANMSFVVLVSFVILQLERLRAVFDI